MLFLIQKEIKQILRNKFLPRIILIFPIAVLLIMPWAMSMELKNVTLCVLDNDKSTLSSRLMQKIEASLYFKVTYYGSDLNKANELLNLSKCEIIMELPHFFSEDLKREQHAFVGIYANGVDNVKGSLGAGYLNQILKDFAKEILNYKENLKLENIYRFNANLEYKFYMIPALMAMVLTLLCGFLPAFSIVGEKEKGSNEQINVTPISKFRFILAKLIPYWLMGVLVFSLCLLLAFLIYGLRLEGSLLLLYLFALVYILVVSGLGLVVSNYSQNLQQAMFVAYFFLIILILMSGLFTSIKSMPSWALIIADLNPLKYFIEALRHIYLKGSSLALLWQNLLALFVFAFILNIWAILSYKKRS